MLRRLTSSGLCRFVRPATYSFSPIQRMTEENEFTKRRRLQWQSRKRGITECDLLLGTFAEKYLGDFTMADLIAYDRIINATSMLKNFQRSY